MAELKSVLKEIFNDNINKAVISRTAKKSIQFNKVVVEKKKDYYQIARYDDKQVFHENIKPEKIVDSLDEVIPGQYRQVNAFGENYEHIVLISKDGDCSYKKKKVSENVNDTKKSEDSHNRKKNYIIEEGSKVPALVDMGVFTREGKVVQSMYDKFRQINRFLEIINDEISSYKKDSINIIDFGCGKSYLTFVIYYYLTEIMHLNVNIIGLDLKKDVIEKCNQAARKYGYKNLKFCVGDVNGFEAPWDVDMVVTLHACDTATDYALYNAIKWNTRMIFSVPCCQHELNAQIKTDDYSILTRYGIIKERFCALATDSIRANMLEYSGYKAQVLEFVDFDSTPKNMLIRAVKRGMNPHSQRAINEVESIQKQFGFENTLYRLLMAEKQNENL